jgi:hypothetical protein
MRINFKTIKRNIKNFFKNLMILIKQIFCIHEFDRVSAKSNIEIVKCFKCGTYKSKLIKD